VVSGLVLGPWYALGVAVLGGGIRMSLLGATLFALPTALPGGVAVGLARRYLPLRVRWTAGFFEIIGTMFGAGLSYALVALGALSSRVTVSVFLGFFLLSSSIGTVLGFALIWLVTIYRRKSLGSLRLKPMIPLTVLMLSVFLSTIPIQGVRGQSMGPPIVGADILGSGSRFGNTTAFLELAQYDYRNNTTFYVHPKSLYFVQSLITRLSPELQCFGCPYYLTNAWISVSFTNSSGGIMYLQVSPITVFADPGGSAGYQNQSPSLKVSGDNLPWGEWINIRTDRSITIETVGLGYSIPLGDLFKATIVITVTNHAEVWENLDSFLIRDAVAMSTYSFVYIVS